MGLFAGTQWDIPSRCERCEKLESECDCPPMPAPPKEWLATNRQTARVLLEKRAKGKWVSVVRGLKPTESDLPTLLTRLKNACGAGGTIREDEIEIQGDHQVRLKELLAKDGYRVSAK